MSIGKCRQLNNEVDRSPSSLASARLEVGESTLRQ
jgi:hypothetical protein